MPPFLFIFDKPASRINAQKKRDRFIIWKQKIHIRQCFDSNIEMTPYYQKQ